MLILVMGLVMGLDAETNFFFYRLTMILSLLSVNRAE